ncbi:MAG: RimK/LysX family protein [Gammaproteobacteria bacterium]
MKNQTARLIIVCLFGLYCSVSGAAEKKTIGWVEPISIDGGKFTFLAKIDTGADGLSINAQDVRQFEKNGQNWVSFIITNGKGREHLIMKPIISYVRVKRKEMKSERRPVIMMDVCLDQHHSEEKVNLVNRGNYKYQGLIGRRFLEGHFLVDSEITNTTKPKCKF